MISFTPGRRFFLSVLDINFTRHIAPSEISTFDLHLAITRFHICDLISHLAPILNFPFSFLQMWRAGTRGGRPSDARRAARARV